MQNINEINEIPSDLIDDYKNKVAEGRNLWKNKKVIICGLARNCENTIDENIERCHRTGKYFKDYKIILFENNSTDTTKEKICHRNDIINIGSDDHEDFSIGVEKNRIKRMSKYRSNIQNYIYENYSDYDYTIVLDFDMHSWSIDGIMTSLAWDKDFHIMGSFSQIYQPSLMSNDGWVHYDRWAFKFHSWYEEWSNNQGPDMAWFWYWKPPIGAKPIQCLSVFGGLAIYKMSCYLNGTYGYRHPHQNYDEITVEHCQFHYSLHQKGYNRIYLNPSQRSIMN